MTAVSPAPGLAEVLTVGPVADGVWSGPTDAVALPHVFGGQLVAQSTIAAGRAAPDGMTVHSVHTVFLRSGAPGLEVALHVLPLHTGRLIARAEVEARQGGRVLCRSTISCTRQSGGITHARRATVRSRPEDGVDLREVAGAPGLGPFWAGFDAVEIRLAAVDPHAPAPHSASAPRAVWMRVTQELPDDPLVHLGALAYASDLMLMSTALLPHGYRDGDERGLAARWHAVSLDHTIWFRRPPRADRWLLFEHTTPMAEDSRALVEAAVFDERGDVVAHVVQEALIRSRDEEGAR